MALSNARTLLFSKLPCPKIEHNQHSLQFNSTHSCPKKHRVVLRNQRINLQTRAALVEFSPDDFSVEKLLGTYGFMNLSSLPPGTSSRPGVGLDENKAAGYDLRDLNRMAGVEVDKGSVEIKLYKGRIIQQGPRLGTRVTLKVYPGMLTGGREADNMAANELTTHAILQELAGTDEEELSQNVVCLLGGFQTSTGEQWLVFRDDGSTSAVSYAQLAAEATAQRKALGDWDFMDRFEPRRPIIRRRRYIIRMLRGILSGLAHAHSRGRLHQSLGPASVVINTLEEKDAAYLVPQLKDFAFSVDVSDAAILKSSRSASPPSSAESEDFGFSEGLWRRARMAGAFNPFEMKAFGISDDIYAAGLLLAYLAFVPLSLPGSIDGPSLQRLLETNFRLDLRAARDYCAADDRWTEAVLFLDEHSGAGWDLLQAMLNPDYRFRPTAAAILNHPFFTSSW